MSLHHGLDEIRAADLPNFSIAGILGRSFVITLWNFLGFVAMALIFAVPALALMWVLGEFTAVQGHIEISNWQIVSRTDETLTFLGFVFIGLLLFLMIQAAVAFRAFRSLGGDGAGFGACLGRAFAVMLHLGEFAIVASIVLGALGVLAVWETAWFIGHGDTLLAWVFGALLAGVLLYIIAGCWVVFPAIVIERIGPIAAVLRSWRLTGGRRWQILVLLAVLVALEYAISHLLTMEIQITLLGPIVATGQNIAIGLNVPLSFLAAVVLTASYYNLVGEKEGMTTLGRIFT
jgi:hypothetical protein